MKRLLLATILLIGPMVTNMKASEFLPIPSMEGNFEMFHGHRQGNGAGLMWAMASSSCISFEIERSYDGEYFDTIGQVQATGLSRYRFVDNSIYPGYIHYRIKANDDDGSVEYSQIVVVRIVSRK